MVKINLSDFEISALVFNRLLNDKVLPTLIDEKETEFDSEYTNLSKNIIMNFVSLRADNFSPLVTTYRPKWIFSKAYATTYTGNYNYIGLNSRRLNRSIASIVGSIAHEWGHCFEYYLKDKHEPDLVMNHGDNSSVGKDNTFQYWLGRAVKRYVEDNLDELLRIVRA